MQSKHFDDLMSSANMAAVAHKITQEVKEYLIVAETEQTKRAQIEAAYKVEIAKIDAIRSSLELFLNRSFEERRQNFEELFSVVRESIRNGDNKTLEVSLTAVVELAKVSPLAEAKSLTSLRSAMEDPDHEFQL